MECAQAAALVKDSQHGDKYFVNINLKNFNHIKKKLFSGAAMVVVNL
jgi:hypothetical protein